MASQLTGAAQSCGQHHSVKFLKCYIQIVVDNNIIEFGNMCDIVAHGCHAPGDDVGRVCAATFEPLCQCFNGGWQDENADAFREQMSDLYGALPVDFEQNVAIFGDLLADPFL